MSTADYVALALLAWVPVAALAVAALIVGGLCIELFDSLRYGFSWLPRRGEGVIGWFDRLVRESGRESWLEFLLIDVFAVGVVAIGGSLVAVGLLLYVLWEAVA